jgi:hypothetical protein
LALRFSKRLNNLVLTQSVDDIRRSHAEEGSYLASYFCKRKGLMEADMRTALIRSVMLVSMLGVSACSHSGGASPPGSNGSGSPTLTWTVESLTPRSIATNQAKSGTPTAFPLASGATPNFGANLPPTGTVFPLEQTSVVIDPSAAGVTDAGLNSGVQLTYRGTQTINGAVTPIFDLTIPDYNLVATGLAVNGGTTTLPDGRVVKLSAESLNYTLFAAWAVAPVLSNSNSNGLGAGISGYQTPAQALPTSGTATYLGNNTAGALGGVDGTVMIATGSTLSTGTLTGQANISVNFGTQAVNGTLSNMTVTPTGGTASQWNNVSLSGTLSGSSILGTTATPATVPGTFGFSASSTGTTRGALFGPNGEELGLVWSLNDPTAMTGKSAFGFVGATKQ